MNDVLETERTTIHISDGQRRIAFFESLTVEAGVTLSTPQDTVRYQYDNHLGSASLELDQTAATISYEEYHPFGTSSYRLHRNNTEASLKRYRYVGKERDEETGLYYYGARYYAAHIARFVSVDPLQYKYPHYTPYQYAGNKPITFIDMDGKEPASPATNTTNFYILQGDTQAELDIKSIVSEKNKQYIEFAADGAVILSQDFHNLKTEKPSKFDKLLKKDEGLKLIYDLISTTEENGNPLDSKILYQTEGPFNFSGIKEPKFQKYKLPQNWEGTSGSISKINPLGNTVRPNFIWNASVTTFGKDIYGAEEITILPKVGYKGQVAIAKGDPLIDELKTIVVDEKIEGKIVQIQKNEIETVNLRKDIIKHELRENYFRTREGKNYNDAHTATVSMYGITGGEIEDKNFRFIWK